MNELQFRQVSKNPSALKQPLEQNSNFRAFSIPGHSRSIELNGTNLVAIELTLKTGPTAYKTKNNRKNEWKVLKSFNASLKDLLSITYLIILE